MRQLTLFVMTFVVALATTTTLAGVAPNSGASAMTQSGAKVAPSKPPVEDSKEQREHGKESTK